MSATTTKRVPLPGTKPSKQPKAKARKKPRPYRKFGLPVQEAKHDLTIPLLQVDVEKAEEVRTDDVNAKGNFLGCVIAQAAARTCGAERVAIMRKTAYVAFPGEGIARRYEIDHKSRAVLEAWDRGEHIVEGVELRLKAPSPQRTRAAMRKKWKQNKQWHKTGSGRKQSPSDPLHKVVRNGNLVRWG